MARRRTLSVVKVWVFGRIELHWPVLSIDSLFLYKENFAPGVYKTVKKSKVTIKLFLTILHRLWKNPIWGAKPFTSNAESFPPIALKWTSHDWHLSTEKYFKNNLQWFGGHASRSPPYGRTCGSTATGNFYWNILVKFTSLMILNNAF